MAPQEHIYTIETLPDDFVEPFSGTLYDRSYGAMPANPFKDDAVKGRQAEIEREFLKLFTNPPEALNVPPEFQRFFAIDYEIGERRRQMTNYNNYMQWRKTHSDVDACIAEQIERYEAGTAEVADVLDIALNTDISDGLEVGRVTHPYWQRMEHVLDMRVAVAEGVAERGGVLEPWVSPYRSISIVPYTRQTSDGPVIDGFIVPYKHDVATMVRPKDGKVLHVVERQIAGIRVDEASGFRQDVLERMRAIATSKKDFDWQNVNDELFVDRLTLTGARGFIEKAIQTDTHDAYLVPESTTIYIFAEDPETSKALGRVAFRSPDCDDTIAYYDSSVTTKGLTL